MIIAETRTSPHRSAGASRQQGAAPSLLISVLGGLDLTFAGQKVRLRNRKARALLAYLALSESRLESRERLAGLLWPDTDEYKARASLRQVVLDIREGLAPWGCNPVLARRVEIELYEGSIEL